MPRTIGALLGVCSCLLVAAIASADDRPIVTGQYEIRLGGERIGDEKFRVIEKKGYVVELSKTVYWPEPMRFEYRMELERSREPKKLELKTTRGGNFTELKLGRKGKNWRLEVKGRGRKTKRHELGRREGAVIDFDSPLFTSLALRQLDLRPDEERDVSAVMLTLPDLAGVRMPQTYRRVADEELASEVAGTVQAAVYELESDGKTHRIWVDPSGLVLKAHFDRIGGEREIVLVRWKEGPKPWLR